MTSFSRFQERNKKRTVAQNKLNTNFIFNSYPSIEITGSDGQKIQASVVNKQEKDYAYISTIFIYSQYIFYPFNNIVFKLFNAFFAAFSLTVSLFPLI